MLLLSHFSIRVSRGKCRLSLTPFCYFHPLHRHFDIIQTITAEISPLHITSSRAQTGVTVN